MDEASLLYKRFLSGDREALAKLVEEFGDPLLHFINSYVRDFHLAEDLMEDCFVELLVKKPNFRGESQFKTYLFRIGKNKALNQLKHSRLLTWVSDDDAVNELRQDPIGADTLIQDEKEQQIRDAIAGLPPDYARAVYLIYFEELSYEEAAKVMGKTKKQIDNYIYRAKKQLGTVLGKEESDENH